MKYANFENYADFSWDGYEAECEKVHAYHKKVREEWKKAKAEKREKAWLRKMCKTDLYFLMYYILGRKDVAYIKSEKTGEIIERPWLFRRCAEVQSAPDGYLDIWARDHYKDIYDDTPLWTIDGWKTQGAVQVGDTVMTPYGFSKVVAVKHFTDSHCRKVNFRSGESIICGNGHLWKVFKWDKGWEEQVCETSKILNPYNPHHNPYIKMPDGSRLEIINIDEYETVPTTCIQIEDERGMYLVGTTMIPTHNSSLITYAKTIQDILVNPEITVCIYAYNMGLAKKMLLQIKNTFESCENLKQLFPDILYKSPSETGWKDKDGVWRKRVWTDEKITVKRYSNPKEATLECSGLVEGQRTGGHYNLLVFDDTVTLDSVRTPEQIKKTTEALFMAIRTGSTANLRLRFIGTRYALYDTYHTVLERGMVKARIHPCYFVNDNGTLSENPVLYAPEEIDLKRINSAYGVFETQELCDPKANLVASFDRDWVEVVEQYDYSNPINMAIICDPAGSLKTKSDYTVFWVVGRNSDDIFYFFEIVRDKILNDKKWEVLKELVSRYTLDGIKPHVYYEQVSMQSDIQYFQKMMSLDHFSFDITPVSGRPKIRMGGSISGMPTKVQRIEALPPLFKQRRIKFVRMSERFSNFEQKNVDMFNQFIEEEYSAYPSGKHDDCLDCMSRIADLETGVMLVKPDKKNPRKENKRITQYDAFQISSDFTPY